MGWVDTDGTASPPAATATSALASALDPGPPEPVVRRVPSRRTAAALTASALAAGLLAGVAVGPGPSPAAATAAGVGPILLAGGGAVPPAGAVASSSPTVPDLLGDVPDVPSSSSTAGEADTGSADDPGAGSSTTTAADDGGASTDAEPQDGTADGSPDAAPSPTATPATSSRSAWVLTLRDHDGTSAFAGGGSATLDALAAKGTLITTLTPAASALATDLGTLTGTAADARDDCDPAACAVPAGTPSLLTQLAAAGRSARAYVGGLGAPCDPAPDPARDPFAYGVATCATDIAPLAQLRSDLAAPPALGWVVLGTDGRDLASTDAALNDVQTAIRTSSAFRAGGLLVVLVDRPATAGSTTSALVLGPGIGRGRRIATPVGPAGLLRLLEDHLGLEPLAGAADPSSTALATAFASQKTPTNGATP